MKKICFLTDSITTYGGIQRCIVIFSNLLINKGYDVSIVCTNNTNKGDNIFNIDDRVKVLYSKKATLLNKLLCCYVKPLKILDKKLGIFKRNTKLQKYIYTTWSYSRNKNILQLINNEKADYVIATGAELTMLAAIYNKKITGKVIGWQHSSAEGYFEDLYKNRVELYKECLQKLYKYIVLTKSDKVWIKEHLGYDCEYIYNFLTFTSDKVSTLENKKMIAVGRLVDAKNYDLLIDAFKLFSLEDSEWTLDIYGNGELKEELINKINEYGLQNRIYIKEFENNIKEKYVDSSLFIICSKREGFGLVLLEAMQCGLAVITSNLPCFKELLNGNEGIIISDNSPDTLSAAMLKMAQNNNFLKECAINAKESSKRFSNEEILNKWLEILK